MKRFTDYLLENEGEAFMPNVEGVTLVGGFFPGQVNEHPF